MENVLSQLTHSSPFSHPCGHPLNTLFVTQVISEEGVSFKVSLYLLLSLFLCGDTVSLCLVSDWLISLIGGFTGLLQQLRVGYKRDYDNVIVQCSVECL